jgi:hypothetical protein
MPSSSTPSPSPGKPSTILGRRMITSCPRELRERKCVENDRLLARLQAAAEEALQQSKNDELRQAVRDTAEEGTNSEHRQTNQKIALATDYRAQPTGNRQHDTIGDDQPHRHGANDAQPGGRRSSRPERVDGSAGMTSASACKTWACAWRRAAAATRPLCQRERNSGAPTAALMTTRIPDLHGAGSVKFSTRSAVFSNSVGWVLATTIWPSGSPASRNIQGA